MIKISEELYIKEWFRAALILLASFLMLSSVTGPSAWNAGTPARRCSQNDNIIIVSRAGNQNQDKMLEERLRMLQEEGVNSGAAESLRAANVRGVK